ncbi:hypothetical protein BC628DRAFT_440959 [Trametes gibbosa]|nr:hypothetical protein BC628DRAFT_440959 [Trametes gibbosa]
MCICLSIVLQPVHSFVVLALSRYHSSLVHVTKVHTWMSCITCAAGCDLHSTSIRIAGTGVVAKGLLQIQRPRSLPVQYYKQRDLLTGMPLVTGFRSSHRHICNTCIRGIRWVSLQYRHWQQM